MASLIEKSLNDLGQPFDDRCGGVSGECRWRDEQLAITSPSPDDEPLTVHHSGVDPKRQLRGGAERSYPADLHPGELHRLLCAGEAGFAYAESLTDHLVYIQARISQNETHREDCGV